MLTPRTPAGRTVPADPEAGFTLIELLITLVIVAALSAVVMTQTVGRLGKSETAALAQNLQSVATAIRRFREDVGRYPDSLQHLARLPAAPRDNCSSLIPTASQAEWAGPYLSRSVPVTGLPSGTSIIRSDLVRTPTSISGGDVQGVLRVEVADVDRTVADGMESAFDGNADFNAGTIRWIATEPDRGVLSYEIPVNGC